PAPSTIYPLSLHDALPIFGKACTTEGRPAKRLTAEGLALLAEYRWPGNVLELRNLMERAAILVEGAEVGAEDLASWLETGPVSEDRKSTRLNSSHDQISYA